MIKSTKARTFTISRLGDAILLTSHEYPWATLQVVPVTPENRETILAALKKNHGLIGEHDHDKSFFVINCGYGDTDGKHPEHFVKVTQQNYHDIFDELADTIVQGAVWYKTNIIDRAATFTVTPLEEKK